MTGPSLPTLLLVLSAVLLALALVGTVLVIRRAATRAERENDAEAAEPEPKESASAPAARPTAAFRARQATDTAASVKEALTALRRARAPGGSAIGQPWYLLIGPQGSGKTALLTNTELASEVLETVEVETGIRLIWNVLEDGTILDVSGDWSFDDAPGAVSAWQRLLRQIARYRPGRPLHGVIVTLPASSFLGDTGLSVDELQAQAALLQSRLRLIQLGSGLRLPVYCVITQCDALPGFTAFAEALTNGERSGILGWSNPFSSDVPFHGDWTDGALASVRSGIERRLNQIFATAPYSRANDDLFLFPGHLLGMQGRLKAFLTRAMRPSSDAPSPLFRGIYLTGTAEGATADWSLDEATIPVSMPTAYNSDYDWGSLALNRTESAPRAAEPTFLVDFARDLVLRKVFGEHALANPLPRAFQFRRERRRLMIGVACGLAVVLTVATALGYRNLTGIASTLEPLLSSIAHDMGTRSSLYTGQSTLDMEVHTPTDSLVRAALELEDRHVASLAYPVSWTRSLDHRVRAAMVPAIRLLVMQRFAQQLEQRAEQVNSLGTNDAAVFDRLSAEPTRLPRSSYTSTPVDLLPEYQQQKAYVSAVAELQQALDRYAALANPSGGGSAQNVVALDAYLNHRPEPVVPENTGDGIIDTALRQVAWPPLRVAERDKESAAAKMQYLSNRLFAATIERNRLRQAVDELGPAVLRVSGPRPSLTDIQAAQRAFNAVNLALADPALAWIGTSEFQLSPTLAEVTTRPLGSSVYLPDTLRPDIEGLAQEAYQRMLNALLTARTPVTGSLLELHDGKLQLSSRAQEVQLGLDNLLNLSFFQPRSSGSGLRSGLGSGLGSMLRDGGRAASQGSRELALPGLDGAATGARIQTYGGAIAWDKQALQAAAEQPAALKEYLSQDLAQAPSTLQTSLGRVARDNIGVTMEEAVSGAESPGARLPPEPRLGADLQPAIQQFADVAPVLRTILSEMRQLGLSGPTSRLQAAGNAEALTLLDGVDRAFLREAPYTVDEAALQRWKGDADPTPVLFGLSADDKIDTYLATQMERVRAFATAAEPLLEFLAATGGTANPVYRRWDGIRSALRQYDAKRPGSLRSLETLIATDLPKARAVNGCAVLPAADVSNGTDYFARAGRVLRDELTGRCDALYGRELHETYLSLARQFNTNLANRFPFAPLSTDPLLEANAQQVGKVFAAYEAGLALLKADTGSHEQNFLQQMDQAAPFFRALTTDPALSVEFIPAFRVARDREAGGNQIAEWTLQVGTQVFHSGEAERRGTWAVGDPVTLSVRWAKDAPFVPVAAESGSMHASARGVTYQFPDAWSLLRLFATLQVPVALADPLRPDPFLLLLRVPETAVPGEPKQRTSIAEARVYLRLTLLKRGKPDTVAAPHFPLPYEAPTPQALKSRLERSRNSGATP